MRLADAYTEYLYAHLDKSPETYRWYEQKLQDFLGWCQQEEITSLEQVQASLIRRYLATLRERINPKTHKPLTTYTVHGYAQVIKGFLNWCGKEELCSERVARRIEMPKVDIKVIETFTPEQVKALFAAARDQEAWLAARDRAILAVLFDTGIRAGELVGLTVQNVVLSPEDAFLRVTGKGRKQREVGLGQESRTALHRYLTRYRHAHPAEPHVFLTRGHKPFTIDMLAQLFYRLRDQTNIKGVRCSPHTARHTYAVNYLAAGGDVYKLSRLMGHSGVSVTENYLRAFKQRDARKGLSVLDWQKGRGPQGSIG